MWHAKSSQNHTTVFGKQSQQVATDFKALAQQSTQQNPYSMVKGGVKAIGQSYSV